jgi:hypothetical protein
MNLPADRFIFLFSKIVLPLLRNCGKIWLLATTEKNAKKIPGSFPFGFFQSHFQGIPNLQTLR